MPEDNKKFLNYVEVDTETHQWLVQEANRAGLKLGDFAGKLLARTYIEKKWNLDNPSAHPMVALKDYLMKYSSLETARRDVEQLAAIYLANPDDTQLAEDLMRACEFAGLDYESVLDTTKNTPYKSMIRNYSSTGKLGKCIDWLSETIRIHPKIPASVITQMASDAGYNKSMLDRARRSLNNMSDQWYIDTVHDAAHWTWELKEITEPKPKNLSTEYFKKAIQNNEKRQLPDDDIDDNE